MSIYQVICQIIGFKDIFSNIPLSWIWDKVINRVPSIDNSLHLHDSIYFHEKKHFSVNHSRNIQPLQAFPVSTNVAIDTLRWPLLVSHQRYSCQARVTSWWVEHPKSSKAPGESCGTFHVSETHWSTWNENFKMFRTCLWSTSNSMLIII